MKATRVSMLFTVGLVSAVMILVAACGVTPEEEEPSDAIVLGLIIQLSGAGGSYGPPVVNAVQLAVDKINAEGGILGREIVLRIADDATDVATAVAVAERLIVSENVDALIHSSTSANREAVLPIVRRTDTVYFYTSLYEGEACSETMFLLGEVPDQYLPAYAFVMDELGGNNWYFLGNDYVWPEVTYEKAREAIRDAGGEVVGQDLVPFDTSEYAEMADKIRASGADHILLMLVGTDAEAFVRQWRAFGLSDTTNLIALALVDNQLPSVGADAEGVYGFYGYFNTLDTPENREFVEGYSEAFGPEAPLQTTLSQSAYNAVWVYKLAAEEAGTTESSAVVNATKGIEFEGSPRGDISVDPETHHVAQHMYLVRATADAVYELVEDFGKIDPGPQCQFD